MDQQRIQDLVAAGLGRAGFRLGDWHDAYRPASPSLPLAPANRFLRLPAAFTPPEGGFGHAVTGSNWVGLFDTAYTRAGDYLHHPDTGETWFVAAQQPLLPVLCIRATRIVGFARPGAATIPGLNGYGGVLKDISTQLLTAWPASVLASGSAGSGPLPNDVPAGSWQVLLPALPGPELVRGDIMTDELGRVGIVTTAERNTLGWRLLVRQATT